MKKIIAIMGSPRKNGNTHLLLSRMIEGVQEAGGTGEIISLVDYKIYDCDGCHTCWKGNACSKNDDMNGLYLKINECDVIIFGTPVYWYGPTAIMKAFLDRFVYYNCPENRQLLKGKSAILVPGRGSIALSDFTRACSSGSTSSIGIGLLFRLKQPLINVGRLFSSSTSFVNSLNFA